MPLYWIAWPDVQGTVGEEDGLLLAIPRIMVAVGPEPVVAADLLLPFDGPQPMFHACRTFPVCPGSSKAKTPKSSVVVSSATDQAPRWSAFHKLDRRPRDQLAGVGLEDEAFHPAPRANG